MTKSNACTYSIIFPIFNESSCLKEVLQRTMDALSPLGQGYEIICIDDRSTDDTWALIKEFHQRHAQVKGLRFSRNFGHQIGVFAGIRASSGLFVAVLDADGQDPPELLPQMFQKCREGYDVVYAVRKKRKEHIFKRGAYALFYRLFKLIVPFQVPLDAGDFSVFSRKVADFIAERSEKKPFIRGLRSWHGGRQTSFEYERQNRLSGPPKYTFVKLIMLALNASISFSKIPLRIISVSGMMISVLAFAGGLVLIALKFIQGIQLLGWTSLALMIMFFGGINLFVLGIVGEYIGDIFDEVKNRPAYLTDEKIGLD